MKNKKAIFVFVGVMLTPLFSAAQKLPNIQKESLHAPSDIKIDGSITEWNGQLKAYNKATSFFYTLSNDDNNLYLQIQVRDPAIIKKVLNTKIVFSVKPSKKCSGKDNISISFPSASRLGGTLLGDVNKLAEISEKQDRSKIVIDSIVQGMNMKIERQFKEIKVNGILALPDTLLSIYNDSGLKAQARLDDSKAYTYELAIPLKFISSASNQSDILYNIKAEGLIANNNNIIMIEESDYMRMINYDTDFSGTYTLARK